MVLKIKMGSSLQREGVRCYTDFGILKIFSWIELTLFYIIINKEANLYSIWISCFFKL